MRLTKSKEDIVNDIRWKTESKLKSDMTYLTMSPHDTLDHFKSNISRIVANAISESFDILLDNIYTNDDFERDLGLKDK